MEYPTKFDTVKIGWPIIPIKGSQVTISVSEDYFCLSSKIDEVLHYGAFHLGLHCLPKYPFRGLRSIKG